MVSKEFLQHITNARKTNELIIDSPDEFKKNKEIFWTEVSKLKDLRRIRIENQNIDTIPMEIRTLTKLEEVSIVDESLTRERGLKSIPNALFSLPNIKKVELLGQRIRKIPTKIKKLKTLEALALENMIWEDIYGEIEEISGGTKIHELPIELFELKNLTSLSINGVELSSIPKQIGFLKSLEYFSARANNILSLPMEMLQLKKLKHLDLQDNQLMIPPEIIGNTEKPGAILESFFASRRPLNEAKVIFIGQGSVGKTSLIQRILRGTFNQNQTKTEGISINQWATNEEQQSKSLVVNDQSPIKLNIWDFGGQEIMHATHQFFLTKRTLYLLVLDARLTQEENRVEYWLKIIQSFGGESPVLIVGNKIDQHPLDIDRTGLRKKFPNIAGILETSAATNAGIEMLKTEIIKQADVLPHVRDLLPETWFLTRARLEKMGQSLSFISRDEYTNLCAKNEVTESSNQETLLRFLHDLGTIFNFADDPSLAHTIVINPQWMTQGIYRILNSTVVFKNKGILDLVQLETILDRQSYPKDKHIFILDMMQRFEMCFKIEDDQLTKYLLPDLLPREEPFTRNWDDVLEFQYEYNILPSSIISRFIVRTYPFINERNVWRSGVIIQSHRSLARVSADYEEHRIDIKVNSSRDNRSEVLLFIRETLEKIHETVPGLTAVAKILPTEYPGLIVDYDELLEFDKRGILSFQRKVGNDIVDIQVKKLLTLLERKKRPNVFISYSHKDKLFVDRLAKDLTRHNISVWQDSLSLKGGDIWPDKIGKGILQSDYFLAILTKDALSSTWVNKEITYAVYSKRNVVPLLYKECDLPFILIELQYVDFCNKSYEEALTELISIIERDS